MRKLGAFMIISLDGYYCDSQGDMSFEHKPMSDVEWYEFVSGNAKSKDTLVFGRVTYQMMEAWWPTDAAKEMLPEITPEMNAKPKIVFSRTLDSADWNNTTLVNEDAVTAMRRMKSEDGPDMIVLGSGTLLTQLADAGLLDSLEVAISPVAIGSGKSLFGGLKDRLDFSLTKSRVFNNGSVCLWLEPRVITSEELPPTEDGPVYRPPE